MTRLEVRIGSLTLKNPIIAASGTFAFGEPFEEFVDLDSLGGIVGKSVSLSARMGNAPPRTVETPSGMLNSIGLEGKGLSYFLEHTTAWMEKLHTARIVSAFGNTPEEYAELARSLDGVRPVEVLELNLSCPNVAKGGLEFGHDPALLRQITESCRKAFRRPLWVKISPNVTELTPFLAAAEQAGADAVTVSNTYVGMAVDWRKRRPVLSTGTGGLSGPAVKPLALAAVWRAARATRLPIVASGGACSAGDVLELMVAGASAVEIGTASFMRPTACAEIARDLERLLAQEKIGNIQDLVRTLALPDRGAPDPV